MMSSTVWVRLVLSPAPSHLVSSMTSCCCVTVPVAVPDEWSIALALCCSCTIAARLTELPTQSCCTTSYYSKPM
jgi:hypothetical protein